MTKNKKTGTAAAQITEDSFVEEAAKVIAELLATSTKEEALSRYKIGQKVNEVKGLPTGTKYGTGVVGRLATLVHLTAAALYEYAKVAEAWTAASVSQYARRGVTFSHFVELAHPDHEERRTDLLERVAKERLSVRDLKALRKKARTDILERLDSEGPSKEIRKKLEEALKTLGILTTKLVERKKQLAAALERCKPIDSDEVVELQQAAE